MYSCSTCSFKGNSMLSIARHCRAVHLLSAKEDYLDLQNSKKTNESSQKEDHDEEMPELFDAYQVPLEFDKSSDEAMFKCPYCSLRFNTQHGLSVHCGMKHHETEPKVSEEKPKPPVQIETSLHIFKCPHCTYVNTIHQGVLTHCQMKHPTLPSRADSLDVDSTFVQNWDECSKKNGPGDIVRFSGHMCETCPQLCATLNKLRKHCEKDHNGTVSSIVQSALKPSAVSQTVISKSYSTQGSVSKASFLSKKINATIRCQQCSYTCRTKIELGRHLRVHHKNTISKDRVYKCALCSKIYFMTKRLAGHYAKKHGREAYLKYYIPMYKQGFEKPAPTSPDCTSTQQPQNTYEPPKSSITTDENKILAFRCPSCPYVNASYHGTLTHCQMKHPAVVARADELQTTEILLTNMFRCSIGKSSNQRGYMCKKCPQIHASLGKLKIHCRRDHDGMTVFEHSTETENKPHYGSQASVSDTAYLNSETSEVNITEAEDCPQPDTSEPCQSNSPSAEYKGLLYKCGMCSYAGSCRKYLYCHLKKTHKLDALTTYRMLENYNIRKRKMPSDLSVSAEPEESANVKCMMCPNLMFDSPQLLIDHYSTFHRLDCKLDFTVLSSGSKKKKTTGIYKCCHCATVLYGIRKLCPHLDRHTIGRKEMIKSARRKTPLVITPKQEFESIQVSMPDELPTLQTVEELIEWNVTPVETFTLPTSPLSSPSKHTDVERPELESREDKHTCLQCGRTFMSMKGLRSHMRSHAALAAIKKLNKPSTSALEININRFIIHKVGTVKPFLCGLCSYRTTVMGLWRSHFMKKHRDVIADPAETHCKNEENALRTDREPSYSSEGFSNLLELDEETELAEESMYLEPPDVQRQLNHYNLVAQTKSKAYVQESKLTENSVFYCEICNFNTGHLSSMRRHYVNRHGKKIFKCKDCNFFTGLRKTLEQHIETGHSTWQSEPTHQMDLRCPFCLYQTKNKNNMIDHIILHREERVVPIEVRRSKLSRYLQGIVFRCHKCTFTSGSEENLRSHMTRHDDIKPYKCRLCYFDCIRLSDLEAHLSDKHQVMRNHELVGQVSLDQLDAKFGSMPGNEEEHSSHLEEHYSDTDNAETEEFITEFNETENPTENNTREKITLQEAHWKRGQGGNEENPGNSHQHENAKPNTTVLKDPQKQAAIDTASQNVKKTVGEGNNCPVEEGQTNDNQAQPRLKDGEGSSVSEQNEKAAEGNSTTYFQPPEKTQAHILHIKAFQPRTLDIEAKVEKDILRHILELDEDGSVCKIQKTANQDRADKVEENIEAKGVDDDLGDIPLLNEEGSTTLVQNPKHPVNAQTVSASAKMNHAQAKNTSTPESFTIEKHLTLSPNCTQLLLSHKDSLGVTCAISKHEKMNSLKNCEDVTEHYGEMPVLENEYLKHERPALEPCKEQEEIDDLNQKDKESEMITEDSGEQCKDLEDPHVYKGALPAIEGAAEVLRSSPAEDKPFTCEFCGRNLMNSSELKRHIMRHGI